MSSVVQYSADRVEAMLARPGMWGTPLSIELSILLLIEIVHVASNEERLATGVANRWSLYLDQYIADGRNLPLSELGLSSNDWKNFLWSFWKSEVGYALCI